MQSDDRPDSAKLSPEQFHILREKGTESPGTGKLLFNHETGVYCCAGCGNEIFLSDAKYDSGSGWPSFYEPLAAGNIRLQPDHSLGRYRTEVVCARCGGHLGHVFTDGPTPTGQRYCINSAAMSFQKKIRPK